MLSPRLIGASFNVATVGANVVAILVGFAALAKYGKAMFRNAVKEEVAPAIAALEQHAQDAARGTKKLSKAQKRQAAWSVEHDARDDTRFDHQGAQSDKILDRLNHIETQGTDAAEKIATVATEAAEKAAKVAVSTALAAEKVAEETAAAREKIAADTAEKVADVAAAKAVALLDAARKDKP